MIARIANLNSLATYTATGADGVERALANNSELFDNDEVECRASTPFWSIIPFTIEIPSGILWVDSGFSQTMSVHEGSGMFICVRLLTSGSSVLSFVSNRGDFAQYVQWVEQVRRQNNTGRTFTLSGFTGSFVGLLGTATEGGDYGMGGEQETLTCKLSADRKQFLSTGKPDKSQIVTMGSDTFRVNSVTVGVVAYSMDLVNTKQ